MSTYPKHQDVDCYGEDLRKIDVERKLNLNYLLNAANTLQLDSAFFTSPGFFDKLAGTDKLRLAILNGETAGSIRQSWQNDLNGYMKMRSKYLLYPDNN